MLTSEQQNNANIAKLHQLAQDALAKYGEHNTDAQRATGFGDIRLAREHAKKAAYWSGMQDGLLRAIAVLEGRG